MLVAVAISIPSIISSYLTIRGLKLYVAMVRRDKRGRVLKVIPGYHNLGQMIHN